LRLICPRAAGPGLAHHRRRVVTPTPTQTGAGQRSPSAMEQAPCPCSRAGSTPSSGRYPPRLPRHGPGGPQRRGAGQLGGVKRPGRPCAAAPAGLGPGTGPAGLGPGGDGCHGAGLTRFLVDQREWVVEIDRPKRPHGRHGPRATCWTPSWPVRFRGSLCHVGQGGPGAGVLRPGGPPSPQPGWGPALHRAWPAIVRLRQVHHGPARGLHQPPRRQGQEPTEDPPLPPSARSPASSTGCRRAPPRQNLGGGSPGLPARHHWARGSGGSGLRAVTLPYRLRETEAPFDNPSGWAGRPAQL
jgi:hypothetical protein